MWSREEGSLFYLVGLFSVYDLCCVISLYFQSIPPFVVDDVEKGECSNKLGWCVYVVDIFWESLKVELIYVVYIDRKYQRRICVRQTRPYVFVPDVLKEA